MELSSAIAVEDVKAVVVETLGVEDRADTLDADTPLSTLPELDSMAVLELLVELERRFDVERRRRRRDRRGVRDAGQSDRVRRQPARLMSPQHDPMTTALVIVAVLIGLPGLIAAAHLGLLAVGSWFYREPRRRRSPSLSGSGSGARRGTGDRGGACRDQRRPAPADVVLVVADRCTDRTAEIARSSGALVLERGADGIARPRSGATGRSRVRPRTGMGRRDHARRRLRDRARLLRCLRARAFHRRPSRASAKREQARTDLGDGGFIGGIHSAGHHDSSRSRSPRRLGSAAWDRDGDPPRGGARPSLPRTRVRGSVLHTGSAA